MRLFENLPDSIGSRVKCQKLAQSQLVPGAVGLWLSWYEVMCRIMEARGKRPYARDIAKPFYAPKKDRETYPLIIGIHGNIPYFFCKWSFQRDNHI
jgi:hypothetical protein